MLLTVVLPAYSIWSGGVTVFYILYLYWWQELIASVLDAFYPAPQNLQAAVPVSLKFKLYLLGIYFVFIVIIFGFITDWANRDLLFKNFDVMFFRNIYFNINLAALLVNEILVRRSGRHRLNDPGDIFTGRAIVLHVSIILGTILYFLVVKRYPDYFTPDNLWGSVLVATPFLLLKTFFNWNWISSTNRISPETEQTQS